MNSTRAHIVMDLQPTLQRVFIESISLNLFNGEIFALSDILRPIGAGFMPLDDEGAINMEMRDKVYAR